MNAQLQFQDLTLGYDRHPAVHHLNGAIASGALVAVVGPNGAGKSTLFKGIVGLLTPLAGRIELAGLKRRDIAYLPQVADIDRNFPINVYDMVAMGLWRSTGLLGGVRAKSAEIHHAIEAVGLTGFEDRPIGTLSGGQMQRVLFARLLLQDARLIVLDELNIALRYDHLDIAEVVATLLTRRKDQHIVVTGRNAKPELIEAADLVTEMTPVKHHFAAGVKAQEGIEF